MEEKDKKEEARIFMLLGIRRSGTSILRKILAASPDVDTMLFEPHPLWHAIMMNHFKRFKGPEHTKKIEAFRQMGMGGKVAGAKFALNPGISELDFTWLGRVYPEAKFVFIFRDEEDTFQSYVGQDKNTRRGAIPRHIYSPMFNWLQGCLWYFVDSHKDRAVSVNYEKMVEDPEKELAKVWKLLGVRPPEDLRSMVHTPKNWGTKDHTQTFRSVAESVVTDTEEKPPEIKEKLEEIKKTTKPAVPPKELSSGGIPKISNTKPGKPIKINHPKRKK